MRRYLISWVAGAGCLSTRGLRPSSLTGVLTMFLDAVSDASLDLDDVAWIAFFRGGGEISRVAAEKGLADLSPRTAKGDLIDPSSVATVALEEIGFSSITPEIFRRFRCPSCSLLTTRV